MMGLPAASTFLPRHRHWKVLGMDATANMSFSAALSGIPTTIVFIHSAYHLGDAELDVALDALGLDIVTGKLS